MAMSNREVRDAFAEVYRALEAKEIGPKDAAQRSVALNGILASARLELTCFMYTNGKVSGSFWQPEGTLSNEQLGARVRHIAAKD